MSRRTGATVIAPESGAEITNSIFVSGGENPVEVPAHLPQPIKDRVQEVFNLNPFLKEPQLPSVIRLAEMEARYRELQDIVAMEGMVCIDRFGAQKPHPAMLLLMNTQNALVTQERNLAISIPTRREQIAKNEDKVKRGGRTPKGKDGGAPALRLA
jgi:hypothetical protein